jgi:hypothetical protein
MPVPHRLQERQERARTGRIDMGILDFLQSPDAQLGIGLLAAGGPTTDPNQVGFGQRLNTTMQRMQADQQQAMRAKLMQSQIDENATQDLLRRATLAQQARRDAYFMGDGGASGVPTAGFPGSGAAVGVPGAQGGSPMAGVQGGSPMGGAPAAGDKFSQWAAQYGIPRDALVNDYLTNGGKGIAEMIAKRGTPDMQVSNGYAYDKNRVGAGYLPQFNVSQDGKSSLTQIGPDGIPVVSAPPGAVETFKAYQGAQGSVKPIKVWDPVQQREVYTNETAAATGGAPPASMAGGRGNVQSSGYSGGDRNSANAESIRMIQSELAKPGNSPADIAAMQREIQRLQLQGSSSPQSGNLAAGPSLQEKATGTFNDKMATEQGDILTKGYTAANDAVSNLQGIQESRKSMQAGAFQGTGADAKLAITKFGQAVGINIDPEKATNTDYLKSTLGNGLLEKAKTLGSNPSNADASRITDIVGSIGKDPGAMAKILDWQEAMARKAIDQHNTKVDQASANGFKSQFDMHVKVPEQATDAPKTSGKVVDALPKTAAMGARMRDTTTGKILKFDGLKWKEE